MKPNELHPIYPHVYHRYCGTLFPKCVLFLAHVFLTPVTVGFLDASTFTWKLPRDAFSGNVDPGWFDLSPVLPKDFDFCLSVVAMERVRPITREELLFFRQETLKSLQCIHLSALQEGMEELSMLGWMLHARSVPEETVMAVAELKLYMLELVRQDRLINPQSHQCTFRVMEAFFEKHGVPPLPF